MLLYNHYTVVQVDGKYENPNASRTQIFEVVLCDY